MDGGEAGHTAPIRTNRGGVRAEEMDLPPDPADLDLEEAEGEQQEPGNKRKGLPKWLKKRKRKHTRYVGTGADRKAQRASVAPPPPVQAPAIAATADAAPSRSSRNKPTKKHLLRQLGYARRETRASRRKAAALSQQLNTQAMNHQEAIASQSLLHQEVISKKDETISSKSRQCIQLSALAQGRRKDLNTAMQQCSDKLAKMEEACRFSRQEADDKVTAAESGAQQRIRAERVMLHSKLVESDKKHAATVELLKKSQEHQSNQHKEHMKQADRREQLLLKQMQSQKMAHKEEVDRMKVEHKAQLDLLRKELRAELSREVAAGKKKVSELEQEQVDMMDIYNDVHGVNETYRKELRDSGKRKVDSLSATSIQRLQKMRDYRDKFRLASDEVVVEKRRIM